MKEKRYFCDLCDCWVIRIKKVSRLKKTLFFILYYSVFIIIAFIICNNKLGQEINTYSVEEYERLDDIANNVIKEGVGIDLSALPDDVISYEKNVKDDEIVFEYCLDNNKDMMMAKPASMTVVLSKDFSIISRRPNFFSKEEYVETMKLTILKTAIYGGFMEASLIVLLICIVGIIGVSISDKNKEKQEEKQKEKQK